MNNFKLPKKQMQNYKEDMFSVSLQFCIFVILICLLRGDMSALVMFYAAIPFYVIAYVIMLWGVKDE